MGQDIFDLIIVLILVFFGTRGFISGFVGEVAGLVSLLGGLWAAHHYHALLAPRLTLIVDPSWRVIAAYVLIFLGVIISVAILARILQKILSFSFVSWLEGSTEENVYSGLFFFISNWIQIFFNKLPD